MRAWQTQCAVVGTHNNVKEGEEDSIMKTKQISPNPPNNKSIVIVGEMIGVAGL